MADTDAEVVTNVEQNYSVIENELLVLYQRCLNEGKTSRQIRKAANAVYVHPVLKTKRHNHNMNNFLFPWFFVSSVLALGIGFVLFNDNIYRLVISSGRNSFIKVLPVLDWTSLYSVSCLIPNPLAKNGTRELLDSHCEMCKNITKVKVLQDHKAYELIEEFIDRDEPVLVQGTSSSQPSISIQTLTELFVDNDDMSIYTGCEFESNLPSHEVRNQRALLMGVRDGAITSFYAHWQNCFVEAAKLFRQVYRRPEYVPSSVELAPSNWVFLCSRFTERKILKMPMQDEFMVLAQLSGDMEMVLTPRKPCNRNCTQSKASLKQGDTLLLTDFFYDLEYITCKGGTSITVGLIGRIDL